MTRDEALGAARLLLPLLDGKSRRAVRTAWAAPALALRAKRKRELLEAESRRASCVGAQLTVLVDANLPFVSQARPGQRYVEAVVVTYDTGGAPSVRGAGATYGLKLVDRSASERVEAGRDFWRRACTCGAGGSLLCAFQHGGGVLPTYVFTTTGEARDEAARAETRRVTRRPEWFAEFS